MNSIIVEETGNIRLSYIDSGPPEATHSTPYTTIFAVHGWMFNGAVFKKLLPLCSQANIRFVAINRRGYPGSSDLTDAEMEALNPDPSGSAEGDIEKEKNRLDYLRARGSEFLKFVNTFVQKQKLPPISEVEVEKGVTKKCGGIAFMGWSLGHSVTFAALANLEHEPKELQTMLATHLRTHILLEPAAVPVGAKPLPGTWVPTRDAPGMSPSSAIKLFTMLVTAYFTHSPGVVSLDPNKQTRDSSLMEHVSPALPSADHSNVPSIYNMSSSDAEEIVSLPPRPVPRADVAMTRTAALWLNGHKQNYFKACFSDVVRQQLLPEMKVVEVLGDKTAAITVAAFWQIWDDNQAEKEKQRTITGAKDVKDYVEFKLLKGANHFMHWDFPQETMDILKEILNG
ncbi:hypothetical protein V5O48_011285 [Marasmius crinis-equi]|uniref:AB hydrolase-1 domain-containing protein n=1 Tax=Marasmius crinis-equi TaxID=585013 RepID=A0ABR3F619_9AGAR